ALPDPLGGGPREHAADAGRFDLRPGVHPGRRRRRPGRDCRAASIRLVDATDGPVPPGEEGGVRCGSGRRLGARRPGDLRADLYGASSRGRDGAVPPNGAMSYRDLTRRAGALVLSAGLVILGGWLRAAVAPQMEA